MINKTAAIPTDGMMYGKIVLTCFISNTSAIADDNIAVSPIGDVLSPNELPVITAL